jgi:hypothetical protein
MSDNRQDKYSYSMPKLLLLLVVLSGTALGKSPSTPSPDAIALALKTVDKALSSCREAYVFVVPDSKEPLLKTAIAADSYDKDMKNISESQVLLRGAIDKPSKISGSLLFMILSTADDVATGVASTRMELLHSLVKQESHVGARDFPSMVNLDAKLSACQTALFNATDDHVDIGYRFMKAEDGIVSVRQ